MANVLKATEDLLKTPEQLAEDKKHKLDERIPRLRLDGMSQDTLISTVEKFFKQLQATTFLLYDLSERQQRQKYDVLFLIFFL